MSVGGFVRRTIYWTYDFIQKRPIGKHYSDIGIILKNRKGIGFYKQKKHLANILEFAVTNSEFYSKYDINNIEKFPVINKHIIKDNYESIKVPFKFIPEQKVKVHIQRTSGSTGTPLAVLQNTIKRNRRIAELKYFGKIAGYNSHEKLAQLRIWTKWQNKTKFQTFKENIYAVDCSRINDEMLSSLCQLIRKKRIKAIWGYASWYDRLVEYIERNAIKIPSLNVVIAGSEMLKIETREKLKAILNCKVVSRYSNEEQGILGQDRDNDGFYYLNHASYFFEFLKLDNNEKAEPGEICRIVVTDLFNYALPLIRYDTGDTCIYSEANEISNGFPVIKEIYGRLLDLVYDTKGNPIHPMALARILKNYDQIQLWQFIQKDYNKYELKLKLEDMMDIDDCSYQLKNIFGENSHIIIKFVDDIPLLASGKRKPVMNEWKT